MAKSRGLQTIQRIAEHGADAASREVAARLRSLHAEEERLRQVRAYLEHYETLCTTSSAGLTIGTIQSRRQFVTRLRDAVERQSQVVEEQRIRHLQQVERWRDARSRALGLQRFNERVRQRQAERLRRHDQAALDEIAQRRR
jgi:flagellar export protein FliJ